MQNVVDQMDDRAGLTTNVEALTLMSYWAKSRKGKSSRTAPRANTARHARGVELYLRKIESH